MNILIFNLAGILPLLGGLTVLVFGAGSDSPDAAIVVWAGWGVIGAAATLACLSGQTACKWVNFLPLSSKPLTLERELFAEAMA